MFWHSHHPLLRTTLSTVAYLAPSMASLAPLHTNSWRRPCLRLSKELSMVSSAKHVSIMSKIDKIVVPNDFFFKFIGAADIEGNSLYECLKCAIGQNKPWSYHDKSRENLRKHQRRGKCRKVGGANGREAGWCELSSDVRRQSLFWVWGRSPPPPV